jgi:hypothetical protein
MATAAELRRIALWIAFAVLNPFAPLRRNTRRNPSRSPNARERSPRAEWAERNETTWDFGSMGSAWERHCLFRCGALRAARARHPSIPIREVVFRSPSPNTRIMNIQTGD